MSASSGGEGAARAFLPAALVVATLVLGVTGAVAGQEAPTGPTDPAFAQSEIDPDAVVMRVDVEADGDAAWTVDFRLRLDDENTTAAFESVAADVERDPSAFTTEFASGMRRTVRSAANRTDREMALRNVTVTAGMETLPQEYGVVTYRFEWTNFATVEDDRIRAGDALSGLFLDSESSLVVAWPEGYEAASVSPEPSESGNNSVTWHGPTDFGPSAPRVVAEPAGGGGVNATLLAAAAFVLAIAGVAGWAVLTRTDLAGDGTAAGAASSTPETGAGGASREASEAAAGGDGGGSQDELPEELLSNEEKILRLLDEEGGRVKQQQIAGEFDWTDAKTSQVVGKLRDQDEVKTFRIGRENVVALPEKSEL